MDTPRPGLRPDNDNLRWEELDVLAEFWQMSFEYRLYRRWQQGWRRHDHQKYLSQERWLRKYLEIIKEYWAIMSQQA